MKIKSFLKRLFNFKFGIIVLLAVVLAGFTISRGKWDFGGREIYCYYHTDESIRKMPPPADSPPKTSNPPLREKLHKKSFETYHFPAKVGGVAFQSVAIPDTSLANKVLELDYDPGLENGKRLVITLDGRNVSHFIPDWMLIPILNYSDSEFNAVVSLFGPDSNDSLYHIVYHEAFDNTLLGVRLLHADILFFDMQKFWKLPEFKATDNGPGIPYTGFGEQIPTGETYWWNANNEINRAFVQANDPFHSWVLNDVGVEVKFNIIEDSLEFQGEPYYFFWRADWEKYQAQQDSLVNLINQARERNDVETHNQIVEQLNELEPEVIPAERLTTAIGNKTEALEKFNPFVYQAVITTHQYTALFRHVKEKYPDQWKQLLQKAGNTKFEPTVMMPYYMLKN